MYLFHYIIPSMLPSSVAAPFATQNGGQSLVAWREKD
jgi:hypothetical protein